MLFFDRKWKMHLYINGIYVGKTKINKTDNPTENIYVVDFWFKKQIFKSLHVKSVIHPTRLLYTDEKNKILHYSFEYETGVEA